MNILHDTKRNVSGAFKATTFADQKQHARDYARRHGFGKLENPHAMIGRTCKCNGCFCCAAAQAVKEHNVETSKLRFITPL